MTDIARRRLVAALATAPVALGVPSLVRAQGKTLTMVRTSSPGSSGDTLSRLLAEHFRSKLDRPVLVESKSGGGGLVALQYIRQNPADGSCVMMCPSSAISLLPAFSGKPPQEAEVQAIVDCAAAPMTITVNPSSGIHTLAEYFDSVRKDPTRGSIGVPSVAGTGALVVYQLSKQLNLPLQGIPYRGGAQLMTDVLGNQVPAAGSILPDYLEQHRNGKLRILAIASDKRSPLAPEIPTFAEAGYPGYLVVTSIGMYSKVGTPANIVNEYAALATEALASEPVTRALHKLGLLPVGGTPADSTRRLVAERARWEPIIKASGIKMDA
jgi:tripartite-type tricarboxylate transporter receptor subunit TctC